MRTKLVPWIACAIWALSLSCGEKENPMGEGLIDAGLAARSDTLIECDVNAALSFQFICPSEEDACQEGPGGSTKLFLGSGYGYQADVALSFEDFPVDSAAVVDSARLQLTLVPWVASPLESLTVHQLTDLFQEAEILFGYGLDTIGYYETPLLAATSFGDSILSIDLTDAVRDWYVAGELPALGLLSHVSPGEEPMFAVFHSSESIWTSEVRPTLVVYLHSEEDSIADTYYPHYDTFLLQRDPQADSLSAEPDRITIGGGFSSRALLRADVSRVPEKATVNLARLRLWMDGDRSVYQDSMGVRVHRVLDDWAGSETEYESVSAGSGWIVPGADSVEIVMSTLTQIWTAGLLEDYGLLLKCASETESIAFVRFVASTDPDPSRRPSLIIEYSMPPPWFQQ